MAVQMKSMIEHRFHLECVTSTVLHVGSGRPGPMTDAEVRRNSRGQVVIPGTSIAGTVRRTIERLAGVDSGDVCCQLYSNDKHDSPCACSVCEFLGNVSPGTGANRGTGCESKVYFFDAVLGEPKTRVVDSVAIDRSRRAAGDAKKFDYAQILPGTPVQIQVRAHNLTTQQLNWLGAALRMLASGLVRIGGRTNRGHGKLKACRAACKIYSRDIAKVDDLLASVTHAANAIEVWREDVDGLDSFPNRMSSPVLSVGFTLETDVHSSLLIADPVAAARSGFDRGMRRLDDRPELPVPSLIGALRSGAERIVRTITSTTGIKKTNDISGTCDLLSAKGRCEPRKDKDDKPVIVDDSWCCLICRLFGNQDWASRLSADVQLDGDAFHQLPMDHVAIDRFTGGASEHRKFDSLAIRDIRFQITLTIDLVAESRDSRWMIGLLALVLRDLNQGRITLGHGSSKGHGFLRVSKPHWRVPRGWGSAVENLQDCVNALWAELGFEIPPKKGERGEAPR